MHVRSHKFPKDDSYICTTYYDKHDKYLDLGFQRLKNLNPKLYPEFSYLKILLVDNNCLNHLPDPSCLPNIKELSCAYNLLINIPYYPNLIKLNLSHNKVLECDQYNHMLLESLDCSYNEHFRLPSYLPECRYLYTRNILSKKINILNYPKLEFLDCGNNEIGEILGGEKLIEVCAENNKLTCLPEWPNLLRLMVDYNDLTSLESYPNIIYIEISHNKLKKIGAQLVLKQIIAHNNFIESIGKMPLLEIGDFSFNKISDFILPNKILNISLHFNPMKNLILHSNILNNIHNLQINYNTYNNIYKQYYTFINHVTVHTNSDKLKIILVPLKNYFNHKIISFIYRAVMKIDFRERDNSINIITLKVYKMQIFFLKIKKKNLDSDKYINLYNIIHNIISSIYYDSIVMTLTFNDHL